MLGNLEIVAEGIRRVAGGKTFVLASNEDNLKISRRQANIISLICDGKSNIEISDEIGISIRGVEKQRQKLYNY